MLDTGSRRYNLVLAKDGTKEKPLKRWQGKDISGRVISGEAVACNFKGWKV